MKKSAIILLVVLSLCVAMRADAVLVRGSFGGFINYIEDPSGVLSDIGIGTKFDGYFLYDSESPIVASFPHNMIYHPENFYIQYTIFGNNETYDLKGYAAANIDIYLNIFSINFIRFQDDLIAGYVPDEGSISLYNSTGDVFDDLSLPRWLNLEDFDKNGIFIEKFGDVPWFTIEGELEYLKAGPVPEPATIILLGSGLIGLTGWGRKKFRKH